jgi:glycosyltransferase involved in cell wall biosynthesis
MKILYISNGLTHYYNLVLSKLNSEPNVEIVVVAPANRSSYVGDGVKQTIEGINFKVVELEEYSYLIYGSFKRLSKTIAIEKPNIIITLQPYLHSFWLNLFVAREMKRLNVGLILKSIPFRLTPYQERLDYINVSNQFFSSLPKLINIFLSKVGLMKQLRKIILAMEKKALNIPDAHVNYVEAFELLSTYGINRETVFITKNSPDTDILFGIKKVLDKSPALLSPNPYRLIHVGRLVGWKRVDMLIRAFASVKKKYAGAELIIVGAGPEDKVLKQLTMDLNLESSVIFKGGIYDPKVLGQYFMSSSLYVLAGMGGISINDAMCFGLPVLCSVADGTEKYLVREGVNGRYFQEGNEKDLRNKIMWCFKNLSELKKMGRNSTDIIRNEINIHTVIKGYMDAFHFVREKKNVYI